jgi:hypothetical protein
MWTGKQIFIPVRGEDGVSALAEFHRKLLADKAYISYTYMDANVIDGEGNLDGVSAEDMSLTYALKRGQGESRTYLLPDEYMRGSREYARLLSSNSVKEYMSIENLLGYDRLNTPLLCFSVEDLYGGYTSEMVDPDTDVREKLTGDTLKELAARLDEDYMAMSADDMMNQGDELFTLHMSSSRAEGMVYEGGAAAVRDDGVNAKSIRSLVKRDDVDFGLNYTVTEKSVKTIAWLKQEGIYDSLMRSAEEQQQRQNSVTE